MDSNSNGWSKYEQFVLRKLEDISDEMQRMHAENASAHAKIYEKLSNHRNELTAMKTKLTVWGIILFAIASTVGPVVAEILIRKP